MYELLKTLLNNHLGNLYFLHLLEQFADLEVDEIFGCDHGGSPPNLGLQEAIPELGEPRTKLVTHMLKHKQIKYIFYKESILTKKSQPKARTKSPNGSKQWGEGGPKSMGRTTSNHYIQMTSQG